MGSLKLGGICIGSGLEPKSATRMTDFSFVDSGFWITFMLALASAVFVMVFSPLRAICCLKSNTYITPMSLKSEDLD